jgi:hypothetical protein
MKKGDAQKQAIYCISLAPFKVPLFISKENIEAGERELTFVASHAVPAIASVRQPKAH